MAEQQKTGFHNYVPYFLVDEKGELIPIYAMADAITECAKVGIKAGNFLLEDIDEILEKGGLIEILRKLSEKTRD
ncbi:hypothetical protein HYT23_03660 [Candidatus Pacearchaeota archaeon]|nr:hypothetical protein [Candidatus Pacearchaeota archaeon]